MTDFDFDDCRAKLTHATRKILDAEQAVNVAGEESADAEALYRKSLADGFRAHRDAGKGVEESNTLARGECVALSRERDAKATALRLAFEKLEDARDSRRSLWRLIEWARGRDLATAGQPENVPADRWP